MNISLLTVGWLRSRGPEADHVREQGLQRAADPTILGKARTEQRILLTMDFDFGCLMAVSHERLPSVVLFCLRNEDESTPRLGLESEGSQLDWRDICHRHRNNAPSPSASHVNCVG